jgi:hypothetical protein
MRTATLVLTLILVLSFFALVEFNCIEIANANPSVFAMMPRVKLYSPVNTTYTSTSVSVNATFEVSMRAFDDTYPPRVMIWLDNKLRKIPAEFQSANETWQIYHAETTLEDLSDGPHEMTLHFENTIASFYDPVVIFIVETRAPIVTILSPESRAYTTSSVPLTFTVNEPFSNVSYMVDSNAETAIDGNTTLTNLADGTHNLTLYATDVAGKLGTSDPLTFEIQAPPQVSILSPRNETLFLSNNQLTLSVSEPVSWLKYSLDGQANVTVTGNASLSWVPSGSHSLTVYACDKSGNVGASDTVQFTVATVTWEWSAIVLIPIASVCTGLFVVLKRRRRKRALNA